MKKVVSAIVLAAGLAAPALAQENFELRIRNEDGVSSGGTTTLTVMTFWLEARYTRTAGSNFGVSLFDNSASTLSSITVADPAGASGSRIGRGSVDVSQDATGADYTRFGRGAGFRFTEPGDNAGTDLVDESTQDDVAFTNASFQQLASRSSIANGFIQGQSIVGISAYDSRGVGPLPAAQWGPANAAGTFSPWAMLYRFQVEVTPTNDTRTITLDAQGNLQGINTLNVVGSSRSPGYSALFAANAIDFTFTVPAIPTPGAAALLGLGGLVAGRRRR